MQTAFLDHPGPLAFAHRGGAAHAPENSWRAFEHAVSLGYGYLETDVQGTADGVAIAFHDRTLERLTGQPGRISRLPYRDLSSALIDGTEEIPRLEDLLTAWPGMRFNLDVKDVSSIGPLAEVLRRTNAWDRVCVVSFSASRLWATRRMLERPVCMATSPLGTAVVRFGGPRGPRDTRGPHRPRAGRPLPPAAARTSAAAAARHPGLIAERLARTGVRCVQVPAAMATPSLIARSHTLGLAVHAWTVNDRGTMERLLDLGVDGIMTDQTVALRDLLSARGQWHPHLGD